MNDSRDDRDLGPGIDPDFTEPISPLSKQQPGIPDERGAGIIPPPKPDAGADDSSHAPTGTGTVPPPGKRGFREPRFGLSGQIPPRGSGSGRP